MLFDQRHVDAAQQASTDQLISELHNSITVDGVQYPTARCERYGRFARDWAAPTQAAVDECGQCPVQGACLVKTLRREADGGAVGPMFRAGFTPEQREQLVNFRDGDLWQAIRDLPD